MGFGMARNLVKAGHDVLAHDVVGAAVARFTAAGGRAARHPAQIGAECSSVILMVVDGAQVEAGLGGGGGLLHTTTPRTLIVCSTIPLSELLPIAPPARA